MIFNCFKCCKAISSRKGRCPYCMIETVQTVEKMEISRASEPLPVMPAEEVARRRAPGSLVYSAMASIGQIVQAMKQPVKKGTLGKDFGK